MAGARVWTQAIRCFSTSLVRSAHYAKGLGKNRPFLVENKWKLLAMMSVFFGSGVTAPFLLVWHQLRKK